MGDILAHWRETLSVVALIASYAFGATTFLKMGMASRLTGAVVLFVLMTADAVASLVPTQGWAVVAMALAASMLAGAFAIVAITRGLVTMTGFLMATIGTVLLAAMVMTITGHLPDQGQQWSEIAAVGVFAAVAGSYAIRAMESRTRSGKPFNQHNQHRAGKDPK